MSDRGFLEKLLDGASVAWKPLGDIAQYSKTRISSEHLDKTNYVGVDNLLQNRAGRVDSSYVPTSGNLTEFRAGDILIGNIRPYLRKIWLADRTGGTNGDVLVIHPTDEVVNPSYLYQVLTDEKFFEYNIQHSKGAKMPRGSKPEIIRYPVPIPCPEDPEKSLAIQAEIVRILDSFTELTAELTAELKARKQQYNHYRDELLSHPSGNMAWKPLGWVGEVRMCKRVMKNQTSADGDIPFFKIGTFGREPNAFISRELFEEFKGKYSYPKVGEVLISASGTIGRSVVFDGEEAYFQDSNIVWLENDESKVLNKYLFYFYQIAKWHVSDGGVIKRLYNDNIKKTLIAVPHPDDPEKSLAEQARIVAILDKFDTLTTSLSEGLPREIKLRQQQYEYYRDLLLSFPKPEEAA
ncbi:restriction endonuclease subunit S [Phaeobacter piscinae]|uniref:restriction endonuclease subunit S n=1 Tax=Phaeobacter piscinae TaxID=1580596 RepID=UPI000BBEDCBF|nr:restriction endonuclease subunit S [Phaeobacter piscinae]ATG40171.1 type I restriction enzyme, S subunit [Phaeobacter piscinae]